MDADNFPLKREVADMPLEQEEEEEEDEDGRKRVNDDAWVGWPLQTKLGKEERVDG